MSARLSSQQVAFLRSLKGAPASILITLALVPGISLTNKDLRRVTKYSDKPITEGLELLELYGLAQNNGRLYGWSLPQGIQLPLFPSALLGRGNSRSASLGSGDHPAPLGDGRVVDNPVDNPVDNLTNANAGDDVDRNNSDLRSELFRSSAPLPHTRAHARGFSSSSSDPLFKQEEEEEERSGVDRNISDLRDANRDVYDQLVAAGVGARSKKMTELLEMQLDPEHVRAFVADRAALGYPVGHLIRKLLDGDPPPPARCRHCGRLQDACYCSVITR